jgi:hypothetical protein
LTVVVVDPSAESVLSRESQRDRKALMRANVLLHLLAVLALCVVVNSQSLNVQYQEAKIVDVHKLPAPSPGRGTDAPPRQGVDQYEVTMQVGNAVYTCNYEAAAGADLSWLSDKKRDVRIEKQSILLKRASGADEVCPIVRKEEPKR